MLKRADEALDCYLLAIKINPLNSKAWNGKGITQFKYK